MSKRLYENLLIQENFLTLLELIGSNTNMFKESHSLGKNNFDNQKKLWYFIFVIGSDLKDRVGWVR